MFVCGAADQLEKCVVSKYNVHRYTYTIPTYIRVSVESRSGEVLA